MKEYYVTDKSMPIYTRGRRVYPIQIKSIVPSWDGEWVTITSTDPLEKRITLHSDRMKYANPTDDDMGYYVTYKDGGRGVWMSTKDFWDNHHVVGTNLSEKGKKLIGLREETSTEHDIEDRFMKMLGSLHINMDEDACVDLISTALNPRSKYERQLERQHQRDVRIMLTLAAAIPVIAFLVYVFSAYS